MRTENWDERFDLLDDFTMEYGVAVLPLFEADCLKEFYDFYEIKNRKPKLIPYGEDFQAAMVDMCGEPRGPLIAGKTEALFGLPKRIMAFDDDAKLRNRLGGRKGLSPFFFVFDLMFFEYDRFTLCFLYGSND